MGTILVPVDFSAETPEVIEAAAMLARRNRSELVLLHVAAAGRAAADEAGDELGRLERYLREEGIPVSSELREGEPAREIVARGGALAADCIIIGRHDHAPATGATGPVTRYVEQQASCTVVAVP